MNGTCVVCGGLATHHHSYCDKHYPAKSATILFLKNKVRDLMKENHGLKQRISQMKRSRWNNEMLNQAMQA